jgi:hypothetical protein
MIMIDFAGKKLSYVDAYPPDEPRIVTVGRNV